LLVVPLSKTTSRYFLQEQEVMIKERLQLNNYSMLFDKDGYLLSIKRNNQFYRFNQVPVIKDLINNLRRDTLTISDLLQVLGMYSMPKTEGVGDRILISNIIM
jgi:hypothetical protein